MRIIIDEKIKSWIACYIRSHRKSRQISIHVVYSKFNENFRREFKVNPKTVIQLLIADGFLKGNQAKGGFSIWPPEDEHQYQQINGTAANAIKSEQPKKLATHKGEHEVNENTIIPHYAFERIPHPQTGKVDVLELIRHIMQQLSDKLSSNPEMDGGFAIGKINLVKTLHESGIPSGQLPEISRIMQEMALIKCYGRSQWGVLHTKAATYFITARSYNIAKKTMLERHKRNKKIAALQKKVEKLENRGPSPTNETFVATSTTSFKKEAIEALAEAELLAEDLQMAKTHIKNLEAERDKLVTDIKKRPAEDEIVKRAFQERLTALKRI